MPDRPPTLERVTRDVTSEIAWHVSEVTRLRQQQRTALLRTITAVVGPGVVFSARELFAHAQVSPALAAAFRERHIQSPKQLGKRLRVYYGRGLLRIGEDRAGVLWTVEVDGDFHQEPRAPGAGDVY